MSVKIKAAIMGGTGYAAAELIKRLVKHPNVELKKISSIDHVGKNVGQVHRSFGKKLPYTLEDLSVEQLVQDIDVVFLCLPHKVSYLKVPEIMKANPNVKIIDFSGDYRTKDAAIYNRYYKTQHTNPENLEKFVYGLPELNREYIKGAQYIANPGCFPTALGLALIPIAKAGLLKGRVRVCAPTGSTGSGVAPSEGTHHPIRERNMKSYRPLFHQHIPEMEQTLRDAGGKEIMVDFVPMSAPMGRGILVNCFIDIDASVTKQQIQNLYEDYYKNSPCVSVCDTDKYPEVIHVAGTNNVEVGFGLRDDVYNGTKTLVALCAEDNLVRGASGQALQNMNIMFDLPELTGLDDFGMWP